MGHGAENMGEGVTVAAAEEMKLEPGKGNGARSEELRCSPSTPRRGRESWNRQLEFTLVCVGNAVGLGNVWRFPYLCYRSGGGAFLVPYLIMLLLCGIPLLLIEFTIGQYTCLGPVHALAKICPLLKGVGVATVVISFLLCTYYNIIITWALYYLFNSLRSSLPWQSCNNTWNIVENCSDGFPGNATHLKSATQQYFDYRLLQMSSGIEAIGSIRWDLFGLLLLAWIIVYFCIFKGVKSTGKVVYFTAIFPYLILIILLINNVQLPGANNGILFFLTPKWSKLLEVQVWVNAAAQIFNSIGIGFGTMMSMASYNRFHNNILKDTLIVAVTNSATSIFAGFVVFSAIGYMGHQHNLPVEDIATDGPGLVFVVYPEAFVTMPIAPLWATLFFFMLICLGVDSQFAMVEVMVTSLMDAWGKNLLHFFKRKEIVVLVTCSVAFMLGIPNVTQGGIYLFQLMDHYTAVVSLMFLAFFEVLAICWFYGVRRLSANYKEMLGTSPNLYFKLCWWVASPLLVTIILVSSIIRYAPAQYGKTYTYPPWAEGLGWIISLCSIIWIPLGAAHTLYTSKGSFIQRLCSSVSPVNDVVPTENQDLVVKLKSGMYRPSCSAIHTDGIDLSKETGM